MHTIDIRPSHVVIHGIVCRIAIDPRIGRHVALLWPGEQWLPRDSSLPTPADEHQHVLVAADRTAAMVAAAMMMADPSLRDRLTKVSA